MQFPSLANSSKLERFCLIVEPEALLLKFCNFFSKSSDDIFFLFFQENRFWYYMQIVSIGDNLHVMSKPVLWEK